MGYTDLTPIQQKSVPALLAGDDVLAAAQTGTGKTAAFALPIITKMLAAPKARRPKNVRALILAPTRELAAQIDENIRAYCAHTKLTSALVFGGVNIRPQTEALAKGADFLVATPGRLLDHIGQKNVDLTNLEFFVLDEADRMLDMGFIHDIRKLIRFIPEKRQTLLFSATFSDEIKQLAQTFLTNPVTIEIARNKESTLITQEAWSIPKKRKRELLRDLIVDNQWDQVLVFTRMKHTANRIASQLEKDGIVAAAIHGNKSQSARTKALSGFKDHSIRVLVATDIAARGLDIEGLPHVINFELPNVAEDYVHRIGRTGRAGVPGHAVSLVSQDEEELLRAIEKLLKRKIDLKTAAGYDGEVPEDIAEDERLRDEARREEMQRLRDSRRQARDKAKKNVKKNPVVNEVETLVKAQNKKVKVSENPADRFEKKIRRKGDDVVRQVAEEKAPSRRAPARGKLARAEANPARVKPANASGKPVRSGKSAAPANGSNKRTETKSNGRSFDQKTVWSDRRTEGKTPSWKRQDARSNVKSTVRSTVQSRRSDNIKSTVSRRSSGVDADNRFESVSSNLPPGMVLRFRRR